MAQLSQSDLQVKRVLAETSPALLGLTVFVSIMHMIFDTLAFKNDISFWRNKKSMEGLSLQSVVMSAVSQSVVFLYLLDNDTSHLILLSAGIGVLIEGWKLTKILTVKIRWKRRRLPSLAVSTRDRAYVSSNTKEHDDTAIRYLLRLLLPLVLGYSAYTMVYETHKSWYSWALGSAVGTVYTFGFVMMTPQLFINYKLKSVAHLPWRQLTYKALNTFIDDLFAFIIKMPTMHRLACFRDDIVFLIFLYQWWIYPVDKSRPNEFGTTTSATLAEEVGDDDMVESDVPDAAFLADVADIEFEVPGPHQKEAHATDDRLLAYQHRDAIAPHPSVVDDSTVCDDAAASKTRRRLQRGTQPC
jgi:hypothetical protein